MDYLQQVELSIQEIESNQNVTKNFKCLRNLCARGNHIQDYLANCEAFQNILHKYLFSKTETESECNFDLTAWQVLANITVNNSSSQNKIWSLYGEYILEKCCQLPFGQHTDIQLMIIYNVLKGGSSSLSDIKALRAIVLLWKNIISEKFGQNLDFLHFLYELYIVDGGRRTVQCLMQLEVEERIIFFDYLANYIRQNSPNGLIHSFLLQHISKEFKMKSDCVLRQIVQIENSHPREVYALLRIIASATGSEKYENLYTSDHSLFLNISGLLRCLVAAGKESQNIFTPMSKLEQVAPSSTKIGSDFELEVSFEMKTLLVRSIANLLYKNPVNKNYCLDTEVMPALFECTNMDARNPLMKEWSILAIRNACIDCPQIQEIVANLTKQGMAKSDIVDELNLEMGSLRIQPNRE